MSSSPRFTRRGMLTAAAALAALQLHPVRAQPTASTGCTVGFLNGLLQFSPDCSSVVTPPALGMGVAPPTHLVALAQALDATTSGDVKPPQSGSRRKRLKARQHHRRKLKLNRRHRRRQRHD